jgi:hypothetical protein
MDAKHFDSLVRSMMTDRSRRGALITALGGTLALLQLEGAVTKKKGKGKGKGTKKKKCGNGKRQCGNTCISAGQCCPSELGGKEECDPCTRQNCNNGVCSCSPALINHHGVCGELIDCLGTLFPCTGNLDCCSERCVDFGNGQFRCEPGTQHCIIDFDCINPPCRGFMCPELYRALTAAQGGSC